MQARFGKGDEGAEMRSAAMTGCEVEGFSPPGANSLSDGCADAPITASKGARQNTLGGDIGQHSPRGLMSPEW